MSGAADGRHSETDAKVAASKEALHSGKDSGSDSVSRNMRDKSKNHDVSPKFCGNIRVQTSSPVAYMPTSLNACDSFPLLIAITYARAFWMCALL
jgi:hypothetical protein